MARYKADPPWTREELILALDLYERMDGTFKGPFCDEYKELSRILQTLPFHPPELRSPHFRLPMGIAAKIGNFVHLDTKRGRRGRRDGISIATQSVWDEFSGQREMLQQAAIRVLREKQAEAEKETAEEQVYGEGKIYLAVHKRRERKPKAVRKKKAAVLAETGRLECEVCEFDFAEVYGVRGVGFAECHHINPLSAATGTAETRPEDLSIVCSNCHRMLHRSLPMPTIAELRSIYDERKAARSTPRHATE